LHYTRIFLTQKDEVTYRAQHRPCQLRDELINHKDNINTMDKILKFATNKHRTKRCLGTRTILEEKKVAGPNGKEFLKLVQEPFYKWMTYEEVDKKSTYLGRYQNKKSFKQDWEASAPLEASPPLVASAPLVTLKHLFLIKYKILLFSHLHLHLITIYK
jgi:hypothetical protein